MTYEIRPVRRSDTQAIHALVRRWETFWGVPRVSSPSRAMEWLTAPSVEPEDDTRAYTLDGQVVAYGLVSFVPSDRDRQLAHVAGMVDPSHRRRGVGTELYEWQIERARERAS